MSALPREDLSEDLAPALSRGYSAVADSVPLARNALVSVAEAAGAGSDQLEAVRSGFAKEPGNFTDPTD